ncbi:DUF31 family putative serine protease [[Mycoplasma] testudinis]|uniref:DUF31 family putative serine protease n=1 Tax=[Mycoplasma] testudinis TaxID=33924 RepID=UPI0004852266|nr:hypothetical protein [[Mycoplasma] testudinis]
MRANKKILLSVIASVGLAASFTTVGIVIGTNQAALFNGNVIYDTNAASAPLVQKPNPSVPITQPSTDVTPSLQPQNQPTPNPQPSESTAELIRRLTDNGESAALAGNNRTIGGVGTIFRRTGENGDPNNRFSYDSFSQGSQNSAGTLAKLIQDGVTLENLPTLSEPISVSDLLKLKENSLRLIPGQKVLNITQADEKTFLDQLNENARVTFNGTTIQASLSDLVKIAQKLNSGTALTQTETQQLNIFNQYLHGPARSDDPNGPKMSDLYGINSIQDVRLKTTFTPEELNTLSQGQVPDSLTPNGAFGGTYHALPAFVNDVQFKATYDNLNRFLPITTNSQRSYNDIINLDFKPGPGDIASGYNKTVISIPGYENVAELYEYTSITKPNDVTQNRYIINIHDIQNMGSRTANDLINTAKSLMKYVNNNSGIGIAIRNINSTTGSFGAAFVKSMPNLVKSLTLFYDWNNPMAADALIDNQNYTSPSNNLTELNIYTDLSTSIDNRNNGREGATILSRIDPRVYQKVNPTAQDYGYNAIFTTMSIKPNTSRADISNAMNYVYVQAKNRREFQGIMGGAGARPGKWDFEDNSMWDMNNFVIPTTSAISVFDKVTFSPLVQGLSAPLDLQNLTIDNTTRVKIPGDPSEGIAFANAGQADANANTYLRAIGKSSRGASADLQTIINYMVRAQAYLRNVDLRNYTAGGITYSTDISEQQIKSASWPASVRDIYYGNNQVFRNPSFYGGNVTNNFIPPNPSVSQPLTADNSGAAFAASLGSQPLNKINTDSRNSATIFNTQYTGNSPSAIGNDSRKYISLNSSEYANIQNNIYDGLNDYSFRIIENTDIPRPGTSQPLSQFGTAWVLDYQKTNDGSYPLTWYFGTNLHTVVNLFNPDGTKSDHAVNMTIRKYNKDTKQNEDTVLTGSTFPQLVLDGAHFLKAQEAGGSLANHFKDFSIIKVTFDNQDQAKKATQDFYNKHKTSVFTFGSNTAIGNKNSQDLISFNQGRVLGYPTENSTSNGQFPTVNQHTGSISKTIAANFANVSNIQVANNYGQSLPGIYDIRKVVETTNLTTESDGTSHYAIDLAWGSKWFTRFGLTLGLSDTNLSGGASGSLAVGTNGQVLGAYWGNLNATQNGFVDPFISPDYYDQNGKQIFWGYDAIHGGNNQTNSLKQYLEKIGQLQNSWLLSQAVNQ